MPIARRTKPTADDTLLKVRKILELERNKKSGQRRHGRARSLPRDAVEQNGWPRARRSRAIRSLP
jgi:hypothetical protein